MKTLFDQTSLSGIKMKNRFIRSATWEGMADDKGHMTDKLFKVYENLARGGAALLITSYAFILEDEQPNRKMMGIYNDSFITEYRQLVNMIHSYESKVVMQIVYGGSMTNYRIGDRLIWGPSAIAEKRFKTIPTEMSKDDIKVLVNAYADAADRVKQAGFDAVEIHAGHGYLLSQFLTPYYNRRTDEYGGNIENRARIIFEVFQAVRKQVGKDYPIFIKINCQDFMDEGLIIDDSKWVCKQLANMGGDAIEVSGGTGSDGPGVFRTKLNAPEKESYHREYAAQVAQEVNVPVILVGGNRSLEVMEEILATTPIEYFSMSRPFLREPDLVNRWQSGDRSQPLCISCLKCVSIEGSICKFVRENF